MRYLDVCSGISAPTMAWKPLGWKAACFAEIEAAPRAVLAHHYPDVPLRGDFTEIEGTEYGPIDLLVGGTPCQSFSIAGLRGGLGDDRGNLALEFARLADRARPRWLVWENVPGVLSIDEGRAFGSILGAMAELGYGTAYRVLDAQHFGVPQRRRRVFVVGYLGDWRCAAAVLFERHSLSGHSAPSREAGKVAPTIPSRSAAGGDLGTDFDCDGGLIASTGNVALCLNADGMGRQDYETETLIAHSLRGEGFDASEEGTGSGTPIIPIDMRQASRGATMTNNRAEGSSGGAPGTGIGEPGDPAPTVSTSHVSAIAFDMRGREGGAQMEGPHETVNIRAGHGGASRSFIVSSAVRRLTPRECERLQGFPDDFTLVPYRGRTMADGPRYKMLGNSMAVPVLRWIGERIAMVERLPQRTTSTEAAAA
jgi:DNA (cytosine-5)-methyltransferase 1